MGLGDSWKFTTMMSSEKKDSVQVLVKLLLTTLLAKERDLDLILTNRKELAENVEVEGNLESLQS